eukprot:1351883-Rhodomonas_salina.3
MPSERYMILLREGSKNPSFRRMMANAPPNMKTQAPYPRAMSTGMIPIRGNKWAFSTVLFVGMLPFPWGLTNMLFANTGAFIVQDP